MKKVIVNTKDRWDSRDHFSEAIVEADGAIKWECNGHYLMDDTMQNIIENGFTGFSVEATRAKREAQNEAFFSSYRKQKRVVSQEELAEMRAAFGTGVTIVDVISGQEITL